MMIVHYITTIRLDHGDIAFTWCGKRSDPEQTASRQLACTQNVAEVTCRSCLHSLAARDRRKWLLRWGHD